MDYLGLKDLVKSYGGYGTGDTNYIEAALNDGLLELATQGIRWPWWRKAATLTTVIDQMAYDLPADYYMHETLAPGPDVVRFTEDRPNVVQWDAVPHVKAQPEWYTIRGKQILLYPIPDAAYTYSHRYWYVPPAMTNDIDVPDLPIEYHPVIAYGALRKMAARDKDVNMVQYWAAEIQAVIERMKVAAAMQHSAGVERIPWR